MRTSLLVGLTAGTLVAAVGVGSVAAINSYNAEPAPERTEVGAFVALYDRDEDGVIDRFRRVCSGTMIDDDTFLTAAHCTDDWLPGTRFFVSLEQDLQTPLDEAAEDGLSPTETARLFLRKKLVVEGSTQQDPAFPGPSSDTHDIGVIDFSDWKVTPADVWDFTPAQLPTAGQLSAIGSRQLDRLDWWVVGYGTQEAVTGPGGQTHADITVRMKAPVDFDALNASWIRLAMIAAQDLGGACYGDSGGPNFVVIDGSLVLAGTTITGDVPCYATNVAYRMDTPSARNFLQDYVTLP